MTTNRFGPVSGRCGSVLPWRKVYINSSRSIAPNLFLMQQHYRTQTAQNQFGFFLYAQSFSVSIIYWVLVGNNVKMRRFSSQNNISLSPLSFLVHTSFFPSVCLYYILSTFALISAMTIKTTDDLSTFSVCGRSS